VQHDSAIVPVDKVIRFALAIIAVAIVFTTACRRPPDAHEPPPRTTPSTPVTELRGGRWFDGNAFVPRTMWIAGAHFLDAPARVDAVIDLHGGFVVPPFAEGHNHWIEPALVDAYIQVHLRDGIFYVKDQLTAPAFHDQMRAALDRPSSVDYISAHQGFTGPNGHPMELVDQLVGIGIFPPPWRQSRGEGDALFAVASDADIARAWPRLLAGHPDFVKVFLNHSDEYAARRDNPALSPADRGIDPALVPTIVARAHAAGLRVSAHIENAHDFHVAIAAGVDDIAHMPFVSATDRDTYRLADADLHAAAARRVSIATTLDWADGALADDPRLDVVRDNLARMRRAGNTIVIGTDLFRTTAVAEVNRIASLNLMSNLDLLRTWCETTPRAIFPGRRIGRLEPGAEASFLVLRADPIANISATRDIAIWFKQGQRLDPRPATFPPLGN
jgi:hypothetical protein